MLLALLRCYTSIFDGFILIELSVAVRLEILSSDTEVNVSVQTRDCFGIVGQFSFSIGKLDECLINCRSDENVLVANLWGAVPA